MKRQAGVLVALSLIATSCGGVVGSTGPTAAAGLRPSPPAKMAPQPVYQVPAGFDSPSALAGDRTRPGVWFISGTDTTTEIFYVSPDPRQDRRYPVGRTVPLPGVSGITVADDGSVWIGLQMTLVHLVPATSQVTIYDVPTPSDNPAAESYRPASVQGAHNIRSVAVSSSGRVALAIDAAAEVTTLDHGVFHALPLPANTSPAFVAYLADGTLGVDLDDFVTHHADHVATFTPVGARSDSVIVSADSLVATGNELVALGNAVTTLDAHAEVVASKPLNVDAPAQPANVFQPAALPSGDLVMPSHDGVLMVSPVTGQTTDHAFAKELCAGDRGGPMPGLPPGVTPLPAGSMCPVNARLVAADAAGNVWMSGPDQSEITLLTAGSM